jgi:hypothetical protein
MAKVYGLWNGGGSYALGCRVEEFPSIGAARAALVERYESDGTRRVTFSYLDGEARLFTPAVSAESSMLVFFTPDAESYPEFLLTLKVARTGRVTVRREAC